MTIDLEAKTTKCPAEGCDVAPEPGKARCWIHEPARTTIDLEPERPGPAERRPGEFARHPHTGAPYVAHPTEVAKSTGKPKRVMYGRPSGLGKQIENATNLQKWAERMVALGIAADSDLADEARRLVELDPESPEFRDAADKVAATAKRCAGATLAAERGTHHHELTEDFDQDRDPVARMAAGEVLGVPVPAQQALLEAWAQMLEATGLEVLATEATVVDDKWRQAGTLDRIARLTRPLCFVTGEGETVDLPAGTVIVLDLKGLALDTPLPTPTGWTTIGAVAVGDRVIGSDGRPCNVVHKSPLRDRPCYRVRFDDGTTVVADDEHRWAVRTGEARVFTDQVLTTAELAASIFGPGGQRQHRVLNAAPLDLVAAALPIDPYVLGVWLGDGKRSSGEITKPADNGIWAEITRRGFDLGKPYIDKRTGCATFTVLGLRTLLRRTGILGHKHVPDVYLRGSEQQRLNLLRGLMDSDGTWNKARRRACFTTTTKALAVAVQELAASLGERAHLAEVERSGFGVTVTSYDVEWAPSLHNPFAEPGKSDRAVVRDTGQNRRRLIVAVDEAPTVPTQCIAVDSPDHTYLCTESMIVTHNTGRLRLNDRGQPLYWHTYSVQVASYAQSVPYDPDTDQRGEWPWAIDQRWGIIAHLDVRTAIDEGEAICQLVAVDLEAGRHAGELCVAAKEWERRCGLFGLVDDARIAVPVDPSTDPTDGPTPIAEILPVAVAEIAKAATTAGLRAHVVSRLERLKRDHPSAAETLRRQWPAGVPGMKGSHVHTDVELQRIIGALEACEAELKPAQVDEGRRMEDQDVAAIIARFDALPAEQRAVLTGWAREANDAGVSFTIRVVPSHRRFEIYRACLEMAQLIDDDDLDLCRATVAAVIPTAAFPTVAIGHALGSLTIAEAELLVRLAAAVRTDEPALQYDLQGGVSWRWPDEATPNSDQTNDNQEDEY